MKNISLSSCISNPKNPRVIKATSKGVTYINKINPDIANNCFSLWISFNSIKHLKHIEQFRNLKDLQIEYNLIQNIEDLEPLNTLRFLQTLNITGNPVTRLPLWDIYVINYCPRLQILNKKPITQYYGNKTKEELLHLIDIEKEVIQYIYSAYLIIETIETKISNPNKTFSSIYSSLDQNSLLNKAYNVRSLFHEPSIDGYFSFLRLTLISLHKDINSLSVKRGSKCSPTAIQIHQTISRHISTISDFKEFLVQFSFLNESSYDLIGLGEGLCFSRDLPFLFNDNSSSLSQTKFQHQSNLNDFLEESEMKGNETKMSSTNIEDEQYSLVSENRKRKIRQIKVQRRPRKKNAKKNNQKQEGSIASSFTQTELSSPNQKDNDDIFKSEEIKINSAQSYHESSLNNNDNQNDKNDSKGGQNFVLC